MIYISIGSNLGNRFNYLRRAVALLKESYLNNVSCSIVLETNCILPAGAPAKWNRPFLNMVVAGECDLSPDSLLQGLKDIEHEMGRPVAYERWSPRIIDLDILLWDNIHLDNDHLTIPHPEIHNRPFLMHLLELMGIDERTQQVLQNSPYLPVNCFTNSFTLSPSLVGIVNITSDSFSDGGLCYAPDKAIEQAISHAANGAVVELGAQSTRPGAIIQGPEAEYQKLKPVLDGLEPFMKNGEMIVSIDTFRPEVIDKILNNYSISWINDVKGELSDDILKAISSHKCTICLMHSLGVPAQKDILIPFDESPIDVIKNWAMKNIERFLSLGFSEESIIIDPGIGFGKCALQSIEIFQNLEALKDLNIKVLVGHSRKSFMQAFSVHPAKDRDTETLAVSELIAYKADYLRVHNVDDHMRFFTAKHAINGAV